jgi:phosphate transport system substrate-binding protein
MKRNLIALLAIGAVALLTAVAAGAKSNDAVIINGAGSTFVQPLVSVWTPALGTAFNYTIQYSGVGSGTGITDITSRSVDFGASDAPLTAAQFQACGGCVQIPWGLGATAMIFNLPGVTTLKLNADVIAKMYLGQITNWNDPAIAALNKGVTLPSVPVTPVWRTGNSGTTYNFTDYLQTGSVSWQKSALGQGQAVAFPTGTGASGSSGVAGVIQGTSGAIGYADIAFALANKLTYASILNSSGNYVAPTEAGIAAAAAAFPTVGPNNETHIVNPPKPVAPKALAKNASKKAKAAYTKAKAAYTAGTQAYPICTYTYIILPLVTSKAVALRRMVFWALSVGQTAKYLQAPSLLFAPIPKAVLVGAEKTLNEVGTS